MNNKELRRVKVLERVLGGSMSNLEAAESLGVTIRHLRRLKNKYKTEGVQGLIHGNRERKPKHALPVELKEMVVHLYDEKYYGSNFCHCSELLKEHEGIELSPSSIGRILKAVGKKGKRPQKRRTKKHQPRERRRQAGMLWQIDASPYEWLGKGFGKFDLHGAIDDAEGIIVGATFTQNECGEGYDETMRQGITKYGIPLATYSDKHTIFRSPNEKLTIDEELDGQTVPLSNFGKAMAELGIEHIKAGTPQAKGRVERLWGTLQDRLPIELRILGLTNIEDANRVLPKLLEKHNRQFQVSAAESDTAYRPLGEDVNLAYVFSKRETRKVGSGNEIYYKNGIYVPLENGYCLDAGTTIEVRETQDGEVIAWHKGHAVKLKKIERPQRAKQKSTTKSVKKEKKPYKPPANHPWRAWVRRETKQ